MHTWNIAGVNSAILAPRLRLEPLGPEHARCLFPLMRQPRIYDWISMRMPASANVLERRWRDLHEEQTGSREAYSFGWAARRESDGAWLGKLDADIRADGVAINVGYWLRPSIGGRVMPARLSQPWRGIWPIKACMSSAQR